MGIPAITVELFDDQIEKIEPLIKKVADAALAGEPGMLLAQIFGGQMKVFFATREQAEQMQRAMGSPVGLTSADRA